MGPDLHNGARPGQRVLVCPPTRTDGEAIHRLLGAAGIACAIFPTMVALCAALGEGAGAVLLSEESLAGDPDSLASCVACQPVWSDLPVLVLSHSGAEPASLAGTLRRIGNVSVVERPVRVSTLMSLVRSALRARDRQYQVRDHLAEQSRHEEEREGLLASEREAREVAERAGRMKDEFLATLSHELRTPLNAMLGWSQILRGTPGLSAEIEEGLTVIERNARSQTQIIEDLLDMSRIISGKVRLDMQRIDLAPAVNAAVETVRPAATAKGVRLHVVHDAAARPVMGDSNRLQQVFWNLLTNAVKFTPTDGAVTVATRTLAGGVQVRVTDTGEGITPEFLPHVFDRFRQADATTTRRHGGLGLGLSIAKQLIELHGGTITADSQGRGTGSTFEVVLPAAGAQAMAARGHGPVPRVMGVAMAGERDGAGAGGDRHDLSGVAVLVIDDEPDARGLMARLLGDHGASVHTAASAAEGLAALRERRPSVLVSDIAMPGEDGYALIGRVRNLPADEGGATPAIAVTAHARVEDRIRAMNSGFQLHLAKPVEPSELIAMVASLAGRRTAG